MSVISTARRSFETEEPYWFWTLGRWDMNAGFFRGFALGFTVRRGEWDVTIGPFGVVGVRRED